MARVCTSLLTSCMSSVHEFRYAQVLAYVNLALMCVFIGFKVVTVFLTVHEVLDPKALFDTGEDVGHHPEDDSGNVVSAENEDAFTQGTRIVHQSRGPGVIYKIDRSDPRGKCYIVRYANMERHHYSKAQVLDKLQVDTRHHAEWPEDLGTVFSPGVRIWHFLYGEGFTISFDESRNAPYLLCYINGQTKWYPRPDPLAPNRIRAASRFCFSTVRYPQVHGS